MAAKFAIRSAQVRDAADLAVLMDIASHGLVSWLWAQMCEPGRSPIELGRERILTNKDLPSYYKNWHVAVIDGAIAGGMGGYKVPDPYHPSDTDGLPDVYSPLLELEQSARGTWHLMALATYPGNRRIGIGGAFLNLAERVAVSSGCEMISIIALSTNKTALRVYETKGYAVKDRRAVTPFEGQDESAEWHLLQKKISLYSR